jgi:hypothetical protein
VSDGTIYLLCIRPAYYHAEHYLGYTDDGDRAQARYQRHLSGNGSPLIRAAIAAGHTVELVWTKPGTRAEERRLKQIGGHGHRLCPVHRAAHLDRRRTRYARARKELTMSDTQDTGYDGSHDVRPRERASWDAEADRELSANATRALAHIKGRTIASRFANRLYDMSRPGSRDALEELRAEGHRIEWVSGRVADDPTVIGGYVLRERVSHEREAAEIDPRFAERRGELRGGRDDGMGLKL